jgi:hypothetical protein
MTQAQLKAAAKYAREYRARHPKEARKASADWKARNPDWWKGRKYVQLLTSALVNGNAKSKVFEDAGMAIDEWINQAACLGNGGLGSLSNGSKLVPVKSWQEFDLSLPADVRRFLDPRNFRLVSK